jgi:uncharacterized protein (DUF305 family)
MRLWIAGAFLLAGCSQAHGGGEGTMIVRPGAPGEGSTLLAPPDLAAAPRVGVVEADLAFVRAMIVHHGQALEMAGWAPEAGAGPEVGALARRIAASQEVEIQQMRRWLERRGGSPQADDATHASATAGHLDAPAHGILTAEELQRLRSLRGVAFDRGFLEAMIRHHEGAIAMVEELFAAPGAGEDAELFHLASEIDGSQRIEIARMARLLQPLPLQ